MTRMLRRLWILCAILALGILALIWRLIDLSVINRHFLQTQYAERTIRDVILPSYRGVISDRNGVPLAISTPVFDIWLDPRKVTLTPENLNQLGVLLNIPKTQLIAKINAALKQKREFVYIKRDVPPPLASQIKNLNIKDLGMTQEYRRFYPQGEVTAQLIGITNIDDQGQEGLEMAYNQWLQGSPGMQKVVRDRYGNEVADLGIQKKPVAGHDLVLSIDNRLQYMAYHALLDGVTEFGAKSGSVIIIDIHTGEILAMANVPSYNPNMRPAPETSSYRNRAVTDVFEPGSTIKPFAMASALISGRYNYNSEVDTSPGYWYVEKRRIDDDGHNNGVISLTRILQVSSNVGMSKVILSIAENIFLDMLNQLGFGEVTGTGFPGESMGLINKDARQSKFALATVSFGYSIDVNLLQLAHAYVTLANDGVKIPLSFFKLNSPPPRGLQVIPPKVAAEIRSMLESVLQKGGGTAVAARVPGYRVTGKTGTTRILGPHGYEKDHHNAIFVGIAPASRPDLVVAIILHDPEKKAYYGGFVAGPVFSRIMGEALRILNIPPDGATST